jgi:uncharacterized coiled-coil protein SlyX
LPLTTFVETGTFEGEAVARMRDTFSDIHSIELSDTYYADAVERFKDNDAISLYHGDSAVVLRSLARTVEARSTVYWLDAHWCVAEETAGERSQCPLLAELTAIDSLNASSVVLIDDARLFLATPPAPHEVSDWPNLESVLQGLRALSATHQISVVNDVIVFYPPLATEMVANYAREHGVDLLARFRRLEALDEEHKTLTRALDERLSTIEELTVATGQRAKVITELQVALAECRATNDQRQAVIDELAAALEDCRR